VAGPEAPGEVAGRRGGPLARGAHDEAALAQVLEGVLEGAEVLREQQVDRAAVTAARADPAPQDALPRALGGLLGEREEDRQLGLVVQLAGQDSERIGVQDRQQLVVGEPEAVLQQGGGGGGQNSWFSPPKTSDTESSVKIRRMESVSRSAQDRTWMFSGAPGRSGIVSVTTIFSKPASTRFS
jgi:hypothetical protein